MDINQLERAVGLVLRGDTDPVVKQQALDYCNEVKASAGGWLIALDLIVDATGARLQEAVLFAYQILDVALTRLTTEELQIVRKKLWDLLVATSESSGSQHPVHIRNKLAQTITCLFVLMYANTWTSMLADLRGLASRSPRGTDMYLRVLRTIHEEIGDTLIIRDPEVVQRNNALKDQIRSNDLADVTASWTGIFEQHTGSSDAASIEILDGVLRVVGGWVSWADLSLLLGNGALVPLIMKQFNVPQLRLRTLDSISEIVSKKMPPENKLQLIVLLNLTGLLRGIQTGDDIDLDERVAHTANIVGLELTRILDSNSAVNDETERVLHELMPTLLSYLTNEYDDTAIQVVPALGDYLQFVRKVTKAKMAGLDTSNLSKNSLGQVLDFPAASNFIPPERSNFLKLILEKAIEKSVYDGEATWSPDDDDDEQEFLDLRNKLKVLQEQVASIDIDLYIDYVAHYIDNSLRREGNSWQETELALYEMSVFGEILKGGAVKTAKGEESRASRVLLELFNAMIDSDVALRNHPQIQLWYMELVHRHVQYFASMDASQLTRALGVFISPLGIHNPEARVRVRSWYLLFRVYKTVRKHLNGPEVTQSIFDSLLPLLHIEVMPVTDNDSEDGRQENNTMLDAQRNLFELCGMLFSKGTETDARLTESFLRSLFADIQSYLELESNASSQREKEFQQLRIHHAIMALGTFSRGMSDGLSSNFKESVTAAEMKLAAQMVVAVLEQQSGVEVVREAVRFTISRLMTLLGSAILLEVSRFINSLLNNNTISELSDFLSFLGQLVHTFREDAEVFEMFTSLCKPLFERVFQALQEAESEASTGSTDSQLMRKELIRSYLQLLFNILNNRFGAVFIVEQNSGVLENVFESLLHYSVRYEADASNQKLAVSDLSKMVQIWGTGTISGDQFGAGQRVPLFDSPLVFTQLTELCWTLTTKPNVSLRDAQTRLVILELGNVEKSMWEARGEWYGDLVVKFLESSGLPSELAQEFATNLANQPLKDFKRYFYDFLVRTQG